ncbi:MAG: LytTR family DNA-binding domain-containing protein [Defluviicoccus sp.]|nr:LytTR family DNA-binding domain-containing protein [Defluviicoccus sp.]
MQELSFTHRELLGPRSFARQGAVLVCLLGLFAFIGPFGTYDSMGLPDRFGYWALALGANWLVCGSVVMLALRLTDAASTPGRILAVAGVALVAAIPGTGVVYTAENLFRPDYDGAKALPTIYLGVAVLMVAISLLVVSVMPRRRTAPADDVPPSGESPARSPGARFLDRLPPRLGRDLVCLRMADHYVEAFTVAGSTLVLMRFADAVAELEGAGGLRVHRSYWVAKRHVSRATRRNGRTVLHLTGGHEAPVSRGYLAEVRAAGLA